jgi:cytochrome P450
VQWLLNLPIVLWRRLLLILQGLGALLALVAIGIRALLGKGGTFGSRIGAALGSAEGQRRVFAVLRLLQPNLVLKRQVITSYPNHGTAIAARHADVTDILTRDADFGVVYGPRMEMITGGENFFLGMQDTPRYTRDVSNMRLAVRRDDVESIIAPFTAVSAAEIVARVPGAIDVPQALTQTVAARLLDHYFGTPGPSQAAIAEWTTLLFWYLFIDLKAEPELDARATAAAAEFRAWMDGHIAARRAGGGARDDVLGRCLAMGSAGLPGMTDRDIRNNLIGLLIGELPTLSGAANLALDELLNRPEAFAGACAAARAGDDALVAAYVFEALRFNPLNPLVYRRAMRDTTIAGGRLRRRRVRKDTMVLAANLSAMFDPLAIPDATSFRTDRPWEVYMLWGFGMHVCFGAHINRAVLPAMLKPLLAQPNLRRAAGARGQIDKAGTPFPQHLHLEFDT